MLVNGKLVCAFHCRFDEGGKGYLTREQFEKALATAGTLPGQQGMMGVPPPMGPWAGGMRPASASPFGQSMFPSGTGGMYGAAYPGTGDSIYGHFGSTGTALQLQQQQPPFPYGAGNPAGGVNPALAQAYQTRIAALSSVAASLLGKREVLAHQASLVEARAGEIAACRSAIERETLADTEAVLHRLRAAESSKLAVLQSDLDALRADVSAIDRFYASLRTHQPGQPAIPNAAAAPLAAAASTTGGATPMAPAAAIGGGVDDSERALRFMRAYPDLCAEADRLIVKPVKTAVSGRGEDGEDDDGLCNTCVFFTFAVFPLCVQIEVRSDDLPREAVERLEICAKHAALLELVAAKDRILLQLLKEREELLKGLSNTAAAAAAAQAREAEEARLLELHQQESAAHEAEARQKAAASSEEAAYWMKLAEELSTELSELTARVVATGGGGNHATLKA